VAELADAPDLGLRNHRQREPPSPEIDETDWREIIGEREIWFSPVVPVSSYRRWFANQAVAFNAMRHRCFNTRYLRVCD
jgi:hypothetical protein